MVNLQPALTFKQEEKEFHRLRRLGAISGIGVISG